MSTETRESLILLTCVPMNNWVGIVFIELFNCNMTYHKLPQLNGCGQRAKPHTASESKWKSVGGFDSSVCFGSEE